MVAPPRGCQRSVLTATTHACLELHALIELSECIHTRNHMCSKAQTQRDHAHINRLLNTNTTSHDSGYTYLDSTLMPATTHVQQPRAVQTHVLLRFCCQHECTSKAFVRDVRAYQVQSERQSATCNNQRWHPMHKQCTQNARTLRPAAVGHACEQPRMHTIMCACAYKVFEVRTHYASRVPKHC